MKIDCPILSLCLCVQMRLAGIKWECNLDGNAPKRVSDVSSHCVTAD